MKLNFDELLPYLLLAFVFFVFLIWIAAQIFKSVFASQQRQQINVLIKVAEKLGVPKEELDAICKDSSPLSTDGKPV